MKIVWDPRKRASNIEKHGLDFATVDGEFIRAGMFFPARQRRVKIIGRAGGHIVAAIVFPLGQEGLSVVSLRFAGVRERRAYLERKTEASD